MSQAAFDFDGDTYQLDLDKIRLNAQLRRVVDVMRDGHWRTLEELARATGDPESSVSARLRDLRKARFGAFTVARRRRGEAERGLFEYRVSNTIIGGEG